MTSSRWWYVACLLVLAGALLVWLDVSRNGGGFLLIPGVAPARVWRTFLRELFLQRTWLAAGVALLLIATAILTLVAARYLLVVFKRMRHP